ncbi:hypothetical protein VaNZ11_013681 [Volvox africanus]|uniref:Ankyrin repeat protein n=1 Tax=Volvox africanus TaxID=51714 RepID=A0ABQ5SIU9_9CHLO|nr:hypothetical protein VaNZ11_013681 [Volvox africanus]
MTSRVCGRSLLDAVRNNSVETVQDILGSGCDNINECDNQQNTPLILAASKGSVALLRLLLGAGADASRQNSSGHTALTRACAAGKVEVVQLLLQAPNAQTHLHLQDNHGNTALLWCARTGNAQLCRLLIDAGANVNQADGGGRTPIFHACVASSLPVAEQLLVAGADLGIRDSTGKCAFDYAQNSEMRALLLSSGSFPEGSRRASSNTFGAGVPSPPCGMSSGSCSSLAIPPSPPGAAPVDIIGATTPPNGTAPLKSRASSSRPSPAYHALTGAVQAGNEAAVIAMLAVPGAEALLAQRDMLHNSVLHVAASRGLLPIMVKLLEFARQLHVDIDEPNIDGHTALYLACRSGHRAVVQALLGAGALPNVASREASTPLHACASGGHADIVRLLLDRGANLNAADSHANTPLLRAADLGHANVCSILLRQGASINHRRHDGSTALLMAVRGGRVGVVQLLLAAGANPNIPDNDGETPLIEAATAGALHIVQTLVAHGVDVQACNHIGETALMRASVHCDASIVDELIAVGARLDSADRELGFTALMYAASQGSAAVVGRLVAAGASVGHANNMGISALLLASRSGYLEVVDRLLQGGASIDQADLKGYTPLMVACVGGYTGVVSHLLRAGANVNLRNYEGYTALSAAVEFGQMAVAELLVRHGADASAITGGSRLGYGAANSNSSLKAAAGLAHSSSAGGGGGANGLHVAGAVGQMASDGAQGGGGAGAGPGTPANMRFTTADLAASVASRAATASSLHMHLDGLPNSVSANNLAREAGGVPPISGVSAPLMTQPGKFLHELDVYDLLQRRNSRNNEGGAGGPTAGPLGAVGVSGGPTTSTLSQGLMLVSGGGPGGGSGGFDTGSAGQRLQSPQRQLPSLPQHQQQPAQQQQLQSGQPFLTVEELTSQMSTSSDTSKDATSPQDKHRVVAGVPGLKLVDETQNGSSPGSAAPKPLFQKATGSQPENLIVLDPDGPDLFEPGMIYRSPWAKIVSFRDPGADDVIWYEPSEQEEMDAVGKRGDNGGGGCGCIIS